MNGPLDRSLSTLRATRSGSGPEQENDARQRSTRDGPITTKCSEFVALSSENGGRVRQPRIVEQTRWSSASLSRVLSEMEADGIVHKISIGRANMIMLVGEEPDWYTLPDHPTEAWTHESEGSTRTSHRAILLIEDTEREAKVLRRTFKDVGLSNPIYTICDGIDAVDFLLQQGAYVDARTPGLVLLDLGLLHVDGLDVLQELNDQGAASRFPVVVYSHSDYPGDVRQSYRAGATAYLTKPDELDELAELVEAIHSFWLSKHFYAPIPDAALTSP